jgi:hypothetical protein
MIPPSVQRTRIDCPAKRFLTKISFLWQFFVILLAPDVSSLSCGRQIIGMAIWRVKPLAEQESNQFVLNHPDVDDWLRVHQ